MALGLASLLALGDWPQGCSPNSLMKGKKGICNVFVGSKTIDLNFWHHCLEHILCLRKMSNIVFLIVALCHGRNRCVHNPAFDHFGRPAAARPHGARMGSSAVRTPFLLETPSFPTDKCHSARPCLLTHSVLFHCHCVDPKLFLDNFDFCMPEAVPSLEAHPSPRTTGAQFMFLPDVAQATQSCSW